MTMQELRWELKNKRFTKAVTGGKKCFTEILTLKEEDARIAIYHNRNNDEKPMILDRKLITEIGNNNIYPTPKKYGMSVPQVSIDGRPQEKLHKILMENQLEDGKEIDHVNHNRFCITIDNLRIATPYQNGCNKRNSLQEIHEANGKFYFKSSIFCGEDLIRNFKACGYTEIHINPFNTGYHYMESKHFDTRKKCAQEARRFNDCAYGKFSYHVENDFEDNMKDFKGGNIGKGTELLIRYKILGEIADKDELLRRNIERLQGVMYKKTPLVDYIR